MIIFEYFFHSLYWIFDKLSDLCMAIAYPMADIRHWFAMRRIDKRINK